MIRESTDRTGLALWLTGAWTAAGTMLYLLWPALAPILLPLCGVAPLAWDWHGRRRFRLFHVSAVSFALLVAVGYALLNAQWSMTRDEALAYAALLLVVVICVHGGLGAWADLRHRPAITAMSIGFYVGFVLAGCLLCFEILSHHLIFFQLATLFPQWSSQAKEYLAQGGLPSYFLNHRMAALAMLFWPALLTALHLNTTGWHLWLLLIGFLPSLVAVGASEHATSQMAFVIGACVALAARWSAPGALRLLMLAWIVACLAVVPLCLAAYQANLHLLRWLPQSAQDRMVIWKATSDLIGNAPLLGVGIHSGRVITRGESERPLAPGTPFRLSVGWHSHNAFLQTWFEAGAVGAGLLLCIGLLVLRAIGTHRRRLQPALLATFASCAAIAATGFSAFAPWLLASYAIVTLFAALAVAAAAAPAYE